MVTVKESGALLFSILVLSLVFNILPILAQDDFIVTVGQNKTFTQFNYNNAWFENDPNNALPWPDSREAYSQDNTAYISLSAVPSHAGIAQAFVGVSFQWNLGQYDWEQVQNWPVKITYEFSYTISASYTDMTGGSGAFVTFAGNNNSNSLYDVVGYPTGSESRTKHVTETISTAPGDGHQLTLGDLEWWGRTLYVNIYAQVCSNNPNQGATNSSSAQVTINSIKIEVEPCKLHNPEGCDDQNKCTLDYCDISTLTCIHTQIPGCHPEPEGECSNDMDCLTNNDACKVGLCDNKTKKCYSVDLQCCPYVCNPPCVSSDPCELQYCDGCNCQTFKLFNCEPISHPPYYTPVPVDPGSPTAILPPISNPLPMVYLGQSSGGILNASHFVVGILSPLMPTIAQSHGETLPLLTANCLAIPTFELPSNGLHSWHFEFDSSYTPPVIVNLPYSEEELFANIEESRLAIYQATTNGWVLLPSVVDPINNRVSAQSNSLGIFALGLISRGKHNNPLPFIPLLLSGGGGVGDRH